LISRIITKTQICDISAIVVAEGNDAKIKDYAGKCNIPEKALYFTDADGRHVNGFGEALDPETSYVLASDLEKFVDKHRLPDLPVHTVRDSKPEIEYPFTQPAIAFTHSGFNIINTLLFLPFIGFLAKFLVWLVPDKVAEKPHLTYLNVRMLDTPAIAIEQSYKELTKMGHSAKDMMHMFKRMLSNDEPDKQTSEQIFQKETDLDVIQKEVVEFIGDMMAGNITHEVMQEARSHLRMADELESISDYVQSLLKLRLKMRNTDLHFSEGGLKDLIELHEKVEEYIDLINAGIVREDNTPDYFREMRTKGIAVTNLMKECRDRHLVRVGDGVVLPLMSLIYTDMLTAYRRIKDHAFNIAEVLAGAK
jgi:phosphate:Na+ symporter